MVVARSALEHLRAVDGVLQRSEPAPLAAHLLKHALLSGRMAQVGDRQVFQRGDRAVDIHRSIMGGGLITGAQWPVKPRETDVKCLHQLFAWKQGKVDFAARISGE